MKKKLMVYLMITLMISNILLTLTIGKYMEAKVNQIVEDEQSKIVLQSKDKMNMFDQMMFTIDEKLKEEEIEHITKIYKNLETSLTQKKDLSTKKTTGLMNELSIMRIDVLDSNGTIQYTSLASHKEDVLSDQIKSFIASNYHNGKIEFGNIYIDSDTGRLTKDVYYSPKNKDFIIRILVDIEKYIKNQYPKQFNDLLSNHVFQSIIDMNPYIKGMDVYSYNQYEGWSLIHPGKKLEKPLTFLNRVEKKEGVIEEDSSHVHKVIHLKDAHYDMTKKFYIEYAYDFSKLEEKKKDIIVFSLLISVILIIIMFIITSKVFDSYVMKRIRKINRGLELIQNGIYDRKIELGSDDEFLDIVDHIEKMKEKIKDREEQLKKNQEKIQYLAYYDTLTNLPNRRKLEEELNKGLEYAKDDPCKMAVLYMDLDNFKQVNDSIGHVYGDLLLKNVGLLLQRYLGEDTLLTRLGGDEFVAWMPRICDELHIKIILEKIIKAFQNPWILDDREFFITVSIGVTIYPEDAEDAQTLLKNADVAMYVAKNNGKNSYKFYSSDMDEKILKRLELENNLRHAIEKEQFVVYYQPKMDIQNGNIIGAEALVRWEHPTKGIISPNVFIPLAEETGLIVPIGEWVLDQACRQIKKWECLGYDFMCVSVNISVVQIKEPDFIDKIRRILKTTKIQPSSLELEITENMVLEDFAATNQLLYDLRRLGINVSLDDFGKGYSSLNYLKQLDIDVIKIDKSFIDDIVEDIHEQAIVKAVIDMAHSMDMMVVAEGVETWEQFNFLKNLECDGAQGYLFSKPIPVNYMDKMIHEDKKIG